MLLEYPCNGFLKANVFLKDLGKVKKRNNRTSSGH